MNRKVPLVVYQCIENGCGLRLAGIVAEEGRPAFGLWSTADIGLGDGDASWYIVRLLDGATDPATEEVHCRRHDFWEIPVDAMLADWAEARTSHKRVVKLDRRSPWWVSARTRGKRSPPSPEDVAE